MTAIEVRRTAALGGHLERCGCCQHERPCYDSRGDRHCPSRQTSSPGDSCSISLGRLRYRRRIEAWVPLQPVADQLNV